MLCIAPLAPPATSATRSRWDDGSDTRRVPSRQPALAPQPQMLVGLELGHSQEIMQHVELVPLGELAQCPDLLGDESDRLLDAALPRFLVTRASRRARCGARPFLSWLSHQPPPESMPAETLRRHRPQLKGGILQLSRYETFPIGMAFNTPRFDSDGLTTHVRDERADPKLIEFGPKFPHKLLELHEYRHCGVAGESQDDQQVFGLVLRGSGLVWPCPRLAGEERLRRSRRQFQDDLGDRPQGGRPAQRLCQIPQERRSPDSRHRP